MTIEREFMTTTGSLNHTAITGGPWDFTDIRLDGSDEIRVDVRFRHKTPLYAIADGPEIRMGMDYELECGVSSDCLWWVNGELRWYVPSRGAEPVPFLGPSIMEWRALNWATHRVPESGRVTNFLDDSEL